MKIKRKAFVPIWLCFLVAFGASCTPLSQPDSQPIVTIALDIEHSLLEPSSETSTPTLIPLTKMPITRVSSATTAVPSQPLQPIPTSTPEPQDIGGQLYTYSVTGIQQILVTNGTSKKLLTPEEEWLDWGAKFSQNKKYLAYWIKRNDVTELWFTPLSDWRPELILEIEGVVYDFATPMWGVNDRYLIFDLSILDNSGLLEDVKTIRNYVIDIEKMELVQEPYWVGSCSILAFSPQTNQLALWCYTQEEQVGKQEFLVLEPEEIPWLTSQAPEPIVDNCLVSLICDWSQDGEHVAYVVTEGYPQALFYTTTTQPLSISLDDKRTEIFNFPAWSPDGQFLYYSGMCADGGLQCPVIMSIVNQEVTWRAKNNSNKGDYGIISVDRLAWEPSSRHIALPVLVDSESGVEGQVLIFDIAGQQEISKISQIEGTILDIVWVED